MFDFWSKHPCAQPASGAILYLLSRDLDLSHGYQRNDKKKAKVMQQKLGYRIVVVYFIDSR
jgi:hypothetical protein